MLRDFKFLRRNSSKGSLVDEIENVPVNSSDSLMVQTGMDASMRPPLNTIQEPTQNFKPEFEQEASGSVRRKGERTPTKVKGKITDTPPLPLRTPDKHGNGFSAFSARNRFGWGQKNEPGSVSCELRDEGRSDMKDHLVQSSHGNGGYPNMTPRSTTRTVGRANAESNSTQNTPTKSVSKPPNPGLRSKVDGNVGGRAGNFAALYKGMPITCVPPTIVNTVEVPHFDLKEDPSFWMEHNVQVLIRIRPLNSMEKSTQGFNRCLKQESAQTVSWVGQPETRFTFDHVACETVDQEMLFRMAGLPMIENCLSGYNSCMFAYGQTGSGKTHTMLGEIEDLEVKPSPNRGMTPRIFEFLFARIRAEEESRRDERLQYSCKCSFLEIYNEQITDLLEPSSTNLLLREDMKNGVYVENLSEFEVQTVSDILKLLLQGSSNRKVAATNMNRESSRSHSVFTCVIESRWEKDSTSNLRFARLNLVDLAGSERQKTSGAEGERLKEAANINKSLSTLGHVIMVLFDVAHGKPKHVPYRDSRLTFLLQDSLGGNSKTMMIANVSPSISCAAETLNTLKFAQRAKLIQNNAVVNEDSSGDVTSLQHQIRLLKEELAILKRQNVSRSLSFGPSIVQDTAQVLEDQPNADDLVESESKGIVRMSSKQLKSLETTLAGALRREQMAETSIKQLEAEIEQLNRLVRQREEDNRCTKMTLRFREDKINRMESLLGGSIPADTYLLQENCAFSEEIQLLQAKADRNPEVTRFALENIRLSDQLRRFQDFYEEGEREILLAEVSELRDQLVQFLYANAKQHSHRNSKMVSQEEVHMTKGHDPLQLEFEHTLSELDKCRSNLNSCLKENAKMSREIHDLRSLLSNLKSPPVDHNDNINVIKESPVQNEVDGKHECLMNHMEEVVNLQLELDILKLILKEEKSSRGEVEEKAVCLSRDLDQIHEKVFLISKECEEAKHELKDAKSVIDALESQQILLINEIDDLKSSNNHFGELLCKQEPELLALKEQLCSQELRDHPPFKDSESVNSPLQAKLKRMQDSPLQAKLKRMQDSLEKAKRLNLLYQTDRAFQTSNEEEMDEVCRQAEAETAEVIVCLQEELAMLQQQVQDGNLKEMETTKQVALLQTEVKELQEKLCLMTQDNKSLSGKLEEKDVELTAFSEEWELLTCDIEEVLADGYEEILDASNQLDLISNSFPQKRTWVSGQVGRIIEIISEKELSIEELRKCLEDANKKRSEVECMLRSLRGAALAITDAHQQEISEKGTEILQLTAQLNAGTSSIEKLENRIALGEDRIRKASVCATVAFVIVNRFSEMNLNNSNALQHKDTLLSEATEMNQRKDSLLHDQAVVIEEAEKQIHFLQKELEASEEICGKLRVMLSQEQERGCAMKLKLEGIEENAIFNTREKLAELKAGVSTLRSCMNMPVEQAGSPKKEITAVDSTLIGGNCDSGTDTELKADVSWCSSDIGKSVTGSSRDMETLESERTCKDVLGREVTIILLKKEIESAFESLAEVQAEIAKLRGEKQEIWLSEKQSQQSMKHLIDQVFALQASMVNFEEQSGLKMVYFSHKLLAVEQILHETCISWCQTKEIMELEVGDAMMDASQKAAEASCILAKFSEAQNTVKEADFMINRLLIANETMKVEIEGLKAEKDDLIDEVQCLKSINNLKDQQYADLEKMLGSNLIETKDLVLELEEIFAQVQTTSVEDFKSIARDIHCMKSECVIITKLMRSGLEDIFTEIIGKDCAVSVLNLCHTGILLETVTGLNAENGFLHHGLCESNSVVADLREHNIKSRRELEICRVLKGKLLADIKNSFDRISRKEEETGELSIKLSTFEKRVLDLQLQEELMLQRSNDMGSELAILMKELDMRNTTVLASLLDHEKFLRDKEEALESQAEISIINLLSKDFQSLILESRLREMAAHKAEMEREQIRCCAVVENLKKEMIILKVDAEWKELLLENYEAEVALLQKKDEGARREKQGLLSNLSQSRSRIAEMDEVNKLLEHEIQLLKDISCSNDTLKSEISDIMKSKGKLLINCQTLEAENKNLQEEVKIKETALELSSSDVANLELQNQKLQGEICLLESSSCKLQKELDMKVAEVENMSCLEEENVSLTTELTKLKADNCIVFRDLEEKKSGYESSLYRINTLDMENGRLQEKIVSLETCITNLQSDVNLKNVELHELQRSQSVIMEDLSSKNQDLESLFDRVSMLKEENALLTNELGSQEKSKHEVLTLSSLKTRKCLNSVEAVDMVSSRISKKLENIAYVDKLFQEIFHVDEWTSMFSDELDCLENFAKDLSSENFSLQTELLRKDDVLKGLLFDLSLLQESASNSKDQKDEIGEMMVSLEALEDELQVKLGELDEAVTRGQMLEAQLQEKMDIISTLEFEASQERESVQFLSSENIDLRTCMKDISAEKMLIEDELTEKRNATDSLEMELVEMSTALRQMNAAIATMKINLNELTNERDQLQIEVLHLKEKLDMAEAEAEGNEAIAAEAQQLAESRKVYAEEKEEEVKLLERSVEELECIVDVLENKVDIVQGEAERQRLQREELESELHVISYQLQNVKSGDADMKRHLDEKEKEFQEALKRAQILEIDIADRDAEISKFKAHISELSLHAEAQASEFKLKFKALEGMVEQVKLEGSSTHVTNSSSNKLEKNGSKSRGSGSPFKCIGLGLVQQMKSEKDEELNAGRLRIEELEALAVTRQKEIFMLNARLAEAESMTHDVLRDLVGVKLDVTNYASLLDKQQQVQKVTEKARFHSVESQVKEEEVFKLKEQLSEFIEERRRWIEEIDRKQAELVAAQISLEKLRQRDQLLKAENEMLKVENVNHKKKVIELEGEMNKLSGQQNLQQRIHHHAKIKEENNLLRIQNEDLSTKLRRAEGILSRVKEELACYRASIGKNPRINFDEEQRLNNKVKEIDEERVQLAQKLLGLCSSILKAAGIEKPVSDISLPVAEEALEQLENRITSLESELEDLRFKNRITTEKNRLSELMPQLSPLCSRTDDDNHQSPKRRVSQAPFFSALDR